MPSNLSRRSLLTTLGKAFGAGGLILSSGRAGALVLPSNLEAAASLPLTTAALPVSPELVRWRGLVDELHAFRLQTRGRQTLATCHEFYTRATVAQDVSKQIAAREHRTWADAIELAELCWRALPKEEAPLHPLGPKMSVAAGFPCYVAALQAPKPLLADSNAVPAWSIDAQHRSLLMPDRSYLARRGAEHQRGRCSLPRQEPWSTD